MRKSLFILILLTASLTSYTQSIIDKNYIVLIFDVKQNNNLHPGRISYWIAESDKLNEKDDFDFSPFFLSLFYTSNAYDDCCLGKKSNFYTFTTESKFEFAEGFEKKQEILREFLKSNEKKFQTIKKQWKNGRKETVTISAVSIKAKICSCKISDNKRYDFESVTLPQSDFELNNEFWKTKNARHLEKDYSSFESKY
jgi:hypothetical protein